jgi:hypothetical protein
LPAFGGFRETSATAGFTNALFCTLKGGTVKSSVFSIVAIAVFLGASLTTYAQTKPKGTATRSKPVTTQKATTQDGREVVLKSDGTWQYAQNSTVNSATNFQGKYQANTRTSTANNTYSGAEQLTIKKATSDTYDWTLEVRGYQTFYIMYGTCKAENNIAECNLLGLKDGYFFPDDIERIKNSGPYFTLKMDGNSLLTKWAKVWGETDDPKYKGFIRYFKRVLSFK